jgi:hypothetical protein
MKKRIFAVALAIMAHALPVAAFEIKNPEPKPRLKIEIESAPVVQENFDRYVQELAAVARRDAESPPQKKDKTAELQAKAINPMVLFRW